MESENRRHPRFCPNDLEANITIVPPAPAEEICFEGTIVDMSYTGIKIKLRNPMNTAISEGEIKIEFTVPESGLPVSIHGMIKHLKENSELGLQYSEHHPENIVDDLMFECIKISDENIQRIIVPIPFNNDKVEQ